MTHDVDVIVIGAGVAGLIAADRLVAAGRRVRVLEALVNEGVRDALCVRTLTGTRP